MKTECTPRDRMTATLHDLVLRAFLFRFCGIPHFSLDNDYILWYERKVLQYIGETVFLNSWVSHIDEEEE